MRTMRRKTTIGTFLLLLLATIVFNFYQFLTTNVAMAATWSAKAGSIALGASLAQAAVATLAIFVVVTALSTLYDWMKGEKQKPNSDKKKKPESKKDKKLSDDLKVKPTSDLKEKETSKKKRRKKRKIKRKSKKKKKIEKKRKPRKPTKPRKKKLKRKVKRKAKKKRMKK